MRKRYGFIVLFILTLTSGLAAQDYPGWTLNEITVQEYAHTEFAPVAVYNIERDEFLVVWQDDRNGNSDVYGCFVGSDGSEVGAPFPICTDTSDQYTPHVDYNRIDEQYLAVWTDTRFGDGNILGVLLDGDGRKIVPVTQKIQDDTSFVICDEGSTQGHPRTAHNWIENTYLVVWVDYRETFTDIYTEDIYAQRLDSDGGLLPPYDEPDTGVNYPIVKWDYEEYYPDVTFVPGIGDFVVNEWLVIWVQDAFNPTSVASYVKAKRIDGATGLWLDSFGDAAPLPEPAGSASKSSVMGAYLELDVSHSTEEGREFYCGSPHVTSYYHSSFMPKSMDAEQMYPVPEVLVVWTDFRNSDPGMFNNPDIYCQRLAYFPDSTARRLGLKWLQNADTTNATVNPLAENGDWADPPIQWVTWDNIEVCRRHDPQSYNGVGLGLNDAEYVIAWNDWRNGGDYGGSADIYVQRLFIHPEDSALVFLDGAGAVQLDRNTNIPVAVDQAADEGAHMYPSVAHGSYLNKTLVAYNYFMPEAVAADADPAGSSMMEAVDIHATVLNSRLPDNAVGPSPEDRLPGGFLTARNYPNPFNPATTIRFRLPQAGDVRIRIFDMLGREIATLVSGLLEAGRHEAVWDGRDSGGLQAASGVYVYRVEAGGKHVSGKMVLMR